MSEKPREFWITDTYDIFGHHSYQCFSSRLNDDAIHVIEYSAYENLLREKSISDAIVDAAGRVNEQLQQKLEIAKEALGFIACEGMDDADFYAEEEITAGTIAMANRARAALAKLESEEK